MTAPKPGDRVRVEFEGIVKYTTPQRLAIGVDGKQFSAFAHPESCTVIVPPVKVGEVLHNSNQVRSLPSGTIIRDTDGDVGSKDQDYWRTLRVNRRESAQWFAYPVTVLWLPE